MDPIEAAFWREWDRIALERDRITIIFHGPNQREQARAGIAAAMAVARVGLPFDSGGSLTRTDGNPVPGSPVLSPTKEREG